MVQNSCSFNGVSSSTKFWPNLTFNGVMEANIFLFTRIFSSPLQTLNHFTLPPYIFPAPVTKTKLYPITTRVSIAKKANSIGFIPPRRRIHENPPKIWIAGKTEIITGKIPSWIQELNHLANTWSSPPRSKMSPNANHKCIIPPNKRPDTYTPEAREA